MTNEEAKETLFDMLGDSILIEPTKQNKAIIMAIKALEQEPCEDCVSRADARHLIAEVNRKTLGCISTKTFKTLYNGVDKLPPVTPQPKTGRWIPVSERLPERPYGCLVTVMDTNPMTFDEFENIYPDFVGWDGESWNDADGNFIPFEVIAWMPLPEPMKVESEDEE